MSDPVTQAAEVLAAQLPNPYLPKAPSDGVHVFGTDGRSYRCSRCGVYNRPDVASNMEALDGVCGGGWAHSAKLRASDNEAWLKDCTKAAQALADAGLIGGQALAKVWDRGYASGFSNAMRRMSDEPDAPTTPNPYRAVRGEGE